MMSVDSIPLADTLELAEAHCNRGRALQEQMRFAEALVCYDRAVMLRPDYATAHCHRGNVLRELNRFEEALASYDRALAPQPDFAEAHCNRGNTLRALRRFDEALSSYERALALQPGYPEAHFNEVACLALKGDLFGAWQKDEVWWEGWRERKGQDFAQPQWNGSGEIAEKTILLHSEQPSGFGDAIQFCRYVPFVASRAGRVILQIAKPLHQLMSSLSGEAQIVSFGDPLPEFDTRCSLFRLPLVFGTRLDTIPAPIPYLAAPASKARAWRDRLGKQEKLRVGLAWSGDPRKSVPHANGWNRRRSIAFDALAPVLRIANCAFYSLQKGDDAVAQLRDSTMRHRVVDWTDDLHDFADTAALIENLDLVISVDTSVAHLTGAVGKPLWLINPYDTCWRWLLDGETSPWYPTARVFRQDATRAWDGAVARVAAALQDHAHQSATAVT